MSDLRLSPLDQPQHHVYHQPPDFNPTLQLIFTVCIFGHRRIQWGRLRLRHRSVCASGRCSPSALVADWGREYVQNHGSKDKTEAKGLAMTCMSRRSTKVPQDVPPRSVLIQPLSRRHSARAWNFGQIQDGELSRVRDLHKVATRSHTAVSGRWICIGHTKPLRSTYHGILKKYMERCGCD